MKIIIIGNGVAGITCAMTARQRDPRAEICVIGGETDFFFARTGLMYAYLDRLTRRDLEPQERHVYRESRIDLVRGWVVDHDAGRKAIRLDDGLWVPYDKLVLAVGALPNMVPWEGVDRVRDGLVHFVSMQDLDACERLTPSTREAVVVGGGLIGIELVECLRYHGKKVTYLVREPYYWPVALGEEEAAFVAAHMRAHGVDVRLSEELGSVRVDGDGRVSGILTGEGEAIPCQMLGIAIGVNPAVGRLREFADAPDLGRGVVVDEQLRTSLPDVYACGDCAEIHPQGAEPYGELIWYAAKRQGRVVGHNLFGDAVRYRPPTFFNSSKFFDLEYTTVGEVMLAPPESPTIYMKHPTQPVSVRVVHDDQRVIGFNMIGSRWDHEILQRWVEEERSPQFVEDHLPEAQFDVEFGRLDRATLTRTELPLHRREWEG